MRIPNRIAWTLPSLALLAACTGVPLMAQKSDAPPPTQATVNVPSVNPIGKTEETQKRGGMTASVSTVPFFAKVVERRTYKQLLTLIVRNDKHNYEITSTPTLKAWPPLLQFKIRLLNRTDDVVRLSGVLVRFNMDGKDYALDAASSGMKSLVDGVLAPQEQKEFDLYAAPAEMLKDSSNFSLRLYGVPTGSKDKGNFEWNYRVALHPESKQLQGRVETAAYTQYEIMQMEQAQMLEEANGPRPPPAGANKSL